MRNIKKSVPYKTSDKSWYYQHCLQETYKIFHDISQVIISHDIVINRNAAPLSYLWGYPNYFSSFIDHDAKLFHHVIEDRTKHETSTPSHA